MKTIEQIKEEKTFYKRNKDAYGNVTRDPYQSFVKRPVQVVTPGTRFLYHLIDWLIITGLSIVIHIALIFLSFNQFSLQLGTLSYSIDFLDILISFSFYAVFEITLQATPGKLIFGYTVIDEYAQKPESSKILLRSISRFVPFEAFSCLSDRGWHDTWSKTYVVKKSEKETLQKLLGNEISANEDLLD